MPLAFQAEPDRVLRVLGVGPGSDPTLMTVPLLGNELSRSWKFGSEVSREMEIEGWLGDRLAA
jgi:hypothetical protein